MEKDYHKIRSDKIEIIDINLDYLRKVDYNDIKKNSLESDLYFLIEENQEMLRKLYEGDGIMISMQKEVTSLMGCIDDYFYYDKKHLEQSEAYQNGLADGKKSGIAEGQKESKLAMAKKLLMEGLPKDLIQRVTGLSKKTLNDLIREQNK